MKTKTICRRMAAILTGQIIYVSALYGEAANGNAGPTRTTTQSPGYFDLGCNLIYAIGAVVGLIGAIKVYSKWSHGDHDTTKAATSWFGSCIFLVVIATILKAFSGIS
jgi:hypothetical protein